MFPDSKIADNFVSARTKTTAISSIINDDVVKFCCTCPLTLLCDGGNDQTDRKYFGIMVRYWDLEPVTYFLCMPVCSIVTAESLFAAMGWDPVSQGMASPRVGAPPEELP